MANLKLFDPLDVEPFEGLFRSALRPFRWEIEPAGPSVKVDVEENDKAYVVKAEIPGVNKDDINVRIDGDTVSISAEVKREKDVKNGGKVIRSERYYGNVQRAFTLGHDIDDAKADARYENGVLELTLPKKASSSAKKIAIH